MLTNPLGEQAFVEGMTMHVVAVAQLIEEAMPHLSKSGVSAAVATALWPLLKWLQQ